MRAVGIHVFAGGFTRGVLDAGWEVPVQLEVHGFGLETTEAMNGITAINVPSAKWPDTDGVMSFSNPRCTAFSTITNGPKYVASNAHGAWAKQTCDVHQFCEYSAGRFDFVVWESVKQAYMASGRELVDHLVKNVFAPRHYRIAHVFINASTFGNAQARKRYFFVAYRDSYVFNIQPPPLAPYYPVLHDAIWSERDRVTREADLTDDDAQYDGDCYHTLTANEKSIVPLMPCGWSLNTMAKHAYDTMPEYFKRKWDERVSELPFSLHGVTRLNWLRPSPTLHSSACRFIHPDQHRPLTVGETALIMGWPAGCWPKGPKPAAQISKGIVPAVGQWLAEQVELSYKGYWGTDDWESSFCDHDGEWKGSDAVGKLEKVFDMTRYVGKHFDIERYPLAAADSHRIWRANQCRKLTAT